MAAFPGALDSYFFQNFEALSSDFEVDEDQLKL